MKELVVMLASLADVNRQLSGAEELLKIAFSNLAKSLNILCFEIDELVSTINQYMDVLRPHIHFNTSHGRCIWIKIEDHKLEWFLDFSKDNDKIVTRVRNFTGVKELQEELRKMELGPFTYEGVASAASSYADYRRHFDDQIREFKWCLEMLCEDGRARYNHLLGMAKEEKWVRQE